MKNCLDFYEINVGNITKIKYLYYFLDNASLINLMKSNAQEYKYHKIIYKIIASRCVHFLGLDHYFGNKLSFGFHDTREKYYKLLNLDCFKYIQQNKSLSALLKTMLQCD